MERDEKLFDRYLKASTRPGLDVLLSTRSKEISKLLMVERLSKVTSTIVPLKNTRNLREMAILGRRCTCRNQLSLIRVLR